MVSVSFHSVEKVVHESDVIFVVGVFLDSAPDRMAVAVTNHDEDGLGSRGLSDLFG